MAENQARTQGDDSSYRIIKIQFVEILSDRFNEEELKFLCFRLGVDYESLPAAGKSNKARELVHYMDRRDRLSELLEEIKVLRPEIPWQEIFPERSQQANLLEKFSLQSTEYFTGRETEIKQITTALQDSEGASVIALYGLGGMGKTALARKAAEICLSKGTFKHVVWVSAQLEKFVGNKAHSLKPRELSLDGLLNEIGLQCSIQEITGQTAEEKERLIRSRLASRPTLLVLDNLETLPDPESFVEQAVDLLAGKSKLLLTSRHKIQRTDAIFLQLGGFDPQTGIRFIREEGSRRGIAEFDSESEETLMEIFTVTGGAPLALKLVIGQLRFQPLELVLQNLKSAAFDSLEYDFYRFIFKRSWDLLSLPARKILVSMSVFDPATGGAVKLVQQVSKVDSIEFFEAMEVLIDMSLVDFVGQLNHRRYVLHPLTHYFVLSDIVKKWG
jgi:hypothetical protein